MSKKRKQEQQLKIWVSQNFLTSTKVIERLLHRTTINSKDHVIEIGAGKGHITGSLTKACRKVTAVEIDKKLFSRLVEKFSGAKNLSLYRQDFLNWEMPYSEEYKVFANIPFCHTTSILHKLTESNNPPIEAWLTMEKGAAKRFMGKPRENFRSLLIKPIFDIEVVYYFLRDDFHPKPGVDVVLVYLKKKIKPDISQSQWGKYKRFIFDIFKGRGLQCMFSKKQFNKACRAAGIYDITNDEILYVQWLCLFRCYCEHVLRINK